MVCKFMVIYWDGKFMSNDYPLNREFLMGHEDSQSTFLAFSQHLAHEMYFVPRPLTFSWVKVMA